MFGIKFNRNTLHQVMKNTKNHIGQAYGFTKNIFNNVDSGVRLFRNIYSIAQPVLEDIIGSDATKSGNKYIKQGLKGYDDIRNKVMETDERAQKHYNTIVGGLEKNKIDIGL